MDRVAVYPVLAGKITERGIRKQRIAETLGCSTRSLYNKMIGKVEFSWSEVCELQRVFFPDMSKEELLLRRDARRA